MTKEQFDNYRFGVNTEILYMGCWFKIDSVDFESRVILPKSNSRDVFSLKLDKIEDIKN